MNDYVELVAVLSQSGINFKVEEPNYFAFEFQWFNLPLDIVAKTKYIIGLFSGSCFYLFDENGKFLAELSGDECPSYTLKGKYCE